jgi:GNAT superfamily N-acetyltransferase
MKTSRMYNYVRSRQLEGTFPGSPTTGTWISTSLRVAKGWGVLEEALWPYDGDENHWPPTEPQEVDFQAKTQRVFAYQRASTVNECRILLASKHLVTVAFDIDDSWFSAPKGIIPTPNNQPISGAHSVSLVGYDDEEQRFIIQNSWGTVWGDAGYGYLPYSYFPDRFLEGWSICDFDHRSSSRKTAGIILHTWAIEDLYGKILHGAEIIDSIEDELIAWGFAIEREKTLELEELFVRPQWRMRGYASQLTTEFSQLARRLRKQLYAWIPHSDVGKCNRPALNAVLRQLGLSYAPSPVRWAAAVGT